MNLIKDKKERRLSDDQANKTQMGFFNRDSSRGWMSLVGAVDMAPRGPESSLGGASLGFLKSKPHSPQNLKFGGFEKLHSGQIFSNLAPHSPQNFMPSGLTNWHFGHSILMPPEK